MIQEIIKNENDIKIVKRGSRLLSSICFFCAVIVFLGGYFFLQYIAKQIDLSDRQELLTRVETIAHIINTDDIAALTGTSGDINSPVYQRVKKMLYDIHDINSNTRFIYFMRSNSTNDKLIFLVDSENPDSKDYSPPGQVYEDTSNLEMENYKNAVSFTEGPYSDVWGTWISGYAPIWSHGNLVGIIGMDISASKWQTRDKSFQNGLLFITLFGSFTFVFIGFYIRHKARCVCA